jgi:hypothetical protein
MYVLVFGRQKSGGHEAMPFFIPEKFSPLAALKKNIILILFILSILGLLFLSIYMRALLGIYMQSEQDNIVERLKAISASAAALTTGEELDSFRGPGT